MTDPLDGIAQYLAGLGLLTYDPTGASGDTFIDSMPPAPDAAVALTLYGSGEPDPLAAEDEVSLQVRIRGGPDPRVSRRRSQAVYSVLHGASGLALPDGTWLVLAIAQQTPTALGIDQNGRHEHVVNYRLTVTNPTVNRS
ncbi:minor capsid protein [Kitasatospora viridis]|uniref:Tail terminator n=1 Tax=Kitasatospora viridis TaxID=281105 RepID=A0A561UKL2_9ACTN|nr:minor capsid protein [Kitasatospora viridis]TWF99911.1 hypothetical protein FHX73_113771 [Kitasatospora viridis]